MRQELSPTAKRRREIVADVELAIMFFAGFVAAVICMVLIGAYLA